MANLKLHDEPLQVEWLDAYGHLNEAYYLVPFTNATWKMQDFLSIGMDYFNESGNALYTVETHLRYLTEVRAPAHIEVETIILDFDVKRIHFAHLMMVDGRLRCTGEFMILHYATKAEKTVPMPQSTLDLLRLHKVDKMPDWAGGRVGIKRH